MKPNLITKRGAPLPSWASRILLAALLLAAPLHADGPEAPAEPDWLAKSQVALVKGEEESAVYAARALKKSPGKAPENRQMSLVLFWSGHFEDSARHMRRALASDAATLLDQPRLGSLMPPGIAKDRLNQLAPDAEADSELCFLTGTLLLIDQDRPRALAFLIRAEELAGTDGQIAKLADGKAEDRNCRRGETALQEGDWEDAARSFMFAALDSPTDAQLYAGLVVALAASGDDAMALKLAANIYSRYGAETLMPWLKELKPKGRTIADAAVRIASADGAGVEQYRLASMLYFVNGWYRSARDTGVKVLLKDKLDDFSRDLQAWLEKHKLDGDPVVEPEAHAPDNPAPVPDQPTTEAPTLESARKLIRRGAYTDAYKVLDLFVNEKAEPEVYHLLFVVLVGRGELQDASTAFQTWFLKASDEQRTRLNSLREQFSTRELFDEWRDNILLVRQADANAGLPRLLNCYVEITCGRYSSARTELVVAEIESPANQVVQALGRILAGEGFQNDRTPDGIHDDPSAKALLGQADREFRAGNYEAAKSGYLAAAEADRTLPFMTVALMRVHFALGDYDSATAQLKLLFTEQGMAAKDARDFKLALESGYDKADTFAKHLEALKAECETRSMNASRWMLYGMILLSRNDYNGARDALQLWYDLDTARTRDPVIVKFYEYARKRAS